MIDRGDGVYVVRALAAPPEVALTVTVGGRPVGAARWRASVVADERPIKIYVKSDLRRMESHAQACGVKRYGGHGPGAEGLDRGQDRRRARAPAALDGMPAVGRCGRRRWPRAA